MSKKDGVISTTIRLDTNTPEGQKAYAFLVECRREKKCRSYSELLTNLLSQCYDRKSETDNGIFSDPGYKDAFLKAVKETIQESVRKNEKNVIAEMKQLIKGITIISTEDTAAKEERNRKSRSLASSFLSEWNAE